LLYFEGALADAPASARSNVESDAETASTAIMMTRHLDIASSIRFGTTQTKQTVKQTDRPKQIVKNRPDVSSLNGCCPATRNMIPSGEWRNNQSIIARKISSRKRRRKK
jgi:hypothetical protein